MLFFKKTTGKLMISTVIFLIRSVALCSGATVQILDTTNLDNVPKNAQIYHEETNSNDGISRFTAHGSAAHIFTQRLLEKREQEYARKQETNKLCNRFAHFDQNKSFFSLENGKIIQMTQLGSATSPLYMFAWSGLSGSYISTNSNNILKQFIQDNNLKIFKIMDPEIRQSLDVIFLAQEESLLLDFLNNYKEEVQLNNQNWVAWTKDTCFEGESFVSLGTVNNQPSGYLAFILALNYITGTTLWNIDGDTVQPLGLIICRQKQSAGHSVQEALTRVLSFNKISKGQVEVLNSLDDATKEASDLQLFENCEYNHG